MEHNDKPYDGQITNYDALYAWTNDHCTPLVREITFENAEVRILNRIINYKN